ncbi:hypothetical protein QRD43_12140 [Pelomonas sp. APW6]|uniref:Type II secretion system protein GspC N-terminal domain-containing protein n=1 Tax=Roseateles subflavus TaxID=3053353 RepID=A0ABT7LLS7_9BURK|nr:hypothetical protein [Pelomonas sp. APW6]MDL5032655.1 hypothetical protein [Pelomonas sp. APW6]
MIARLSAFLVWALLGLAIVYWGMTLGLRSPAAPAQTLAVADAAAPRSDLGRLLGVTPAQAEAAPSPDESRFKLLGLVAPKRVDGHEQEGVALISVDGGPPRTVRVGALVDGDRQLLAITTSGVRIGREGGPSITLSLAPLLPAQGVALPSQPPATYALSAPMAQPAPPLQGVAPPMGAQPDPGAVPGMMPPATLPPPRPQAAQAGQPSQVPPPAPGPNSLPLR